MQGRSLIRAVEIGLVATVLGASCLLGLLVWSAHRLDRSARASEAEIVRQGLEPEIAEFRQGLGQAAADPANWIDLDRQRQILYPPRAIAEERQGRIAQLIEIGAARRYLDRLRDSHAREHGAKPRIDFVILGAEGGEELALVAPVPARDGGKPSLAIALVDFSELTQRLERFSLHLQPLRAPDGGAGAHGALHLTGGSGEVVAVLTWTSARASDVLHAVLLPALIAVFALAMAGLLGLRALLTGAKVPAGAPFEMPHSTGHMQLAAARNPAKIDSLMQVS